MTLAVLFSEAATIARRPKPDVRYQTDPIGWMVDVMGIPEHTLRWSKNPGYESHRWDGTPDPLVVICEAVAAGKDVGVESATGTGKTRLGALLVEWYEAVFADSIVVTLAPKAEQLRKHLWKEIGRDWRRFSERYPDVALLDLNLRMKGDDPDKESWAAVGFPVGVEAGAESATKAQGFHADRLFFVFEETPGIPKPVMTAVENTCTGENNQRLAFGNPDHQQDALHGFCTEPGVVHVRISAYDHPNVVTGQEIIPGAVTRKAIERRKLKYGTSSRLYQSRVRGISPSESASGLIRLAWCAAAKNNVQPLLWHARRERALGVDVANSEAGDLAAIARGSGAILEEVEAFPCPNANKLGERVVTEARTLGIDPQHVGVDSVGVGAGTVNEAARLDFWLRALNGGSRAEDALDAERFLNLRSQMWWQMRVDLESRMIALPDDDELIEDLTAPEWETRNGKIVVESKETIKERLGRSPNKGDAAVYWNWVRSRDTEIEPAKPPATTLEEIAWREQIGDLNPDDDDEYTTTSEPDYGHALRN